MIKTVYLAENQSVSWGSQEHNIINTLVIFILCIVADAPAYATIHNIHYAPFVCRLLSDPLC